MAAQTSAQSTSLYDLFVPQFLHVLRGMHTYLDKLEAHAEAKKFDVKNVLNARLAPDQFHFIRQVQIACDSAKGAAARVSGREVPKHEDNEQTVVELRARIKKVTDYLESFKPEDMLGDPKRLVEIPGPKGKALPAFDFIQQVATPNLYFHTTTAYAILRHNGVDLGKLDFLGKLNLTDL